MAYDWTQIGNEEITNLYLYDDLNTPSDLASDSLFKKNRSVSFSCFGTVGIGSIGYEL